MAIHRVKKGLDLPIAGAPAETKEAARAVSRVALLARDFIGMKPKMLVQAGDEVRRGDPLFEDRKNPGVLHVAPGAGRVEEVHRGAKRALLSVVIDLAEGEADAEDRHRTFEGHASADADRESARAFLKTSGLWTSLRTRPFSRVPALDATPRTIFVTATDTQPLAPPVPETLAGREEDLVRGLRILKKLGDGPVYLCRAPGAAVEPGDSGAQVEEFAGVHPAGTVGYHIHVLDPVYRGKEVWHIGVQDVARIGATARTGRLDVHKTISLAGPMVEKPRLLATRVGAHLGELTARELKKGQSRVISGSVLSGRIAAGDQLGYLGSYDQQVSVLAEEAKREFLGWLAPGGDKFSILPIFTSWLAREKKFSFTTTTNGSKRAMVPIGMYERVMPMDLMPTHLLRALSVGDVEWAEELGVLELDEEDLALCTFVDPGKTDFGGYLRDVLDQIHKEG